MAVSSLEIKELIVSSCEKDVEPSAIEDDELLFGPGTGLALDSLDALQVSMAIQKRYGLRLVDSKETRRILSTVATLVAVLERRAAEAAG